jgi:phosphatidylglycerol:prolipoprotein diacylglycerol transferase
MITFPDINPVAVQIGPIAIYWYGISYVVGILLGLSYAKHLSKKYSLDLTEKLLDDYLVYLIIGVILGGRIGYILLYDPIRYFTNPLEIFQIRSGGMSFHGGVLGVGVLSYVFCKRNNIRFLALTDVVSIVAPIAIFFGRIANFINGELYGKVTSEPWGVLFPGEVQGRHASQIYEAFFEGVILLIIMYLASKKTRQIGYNTGIFLIFYHIFRIFCELFREPDIQLGFIISEISMGQLLSMPFLILGLYFINRSQCQLNQK